jgi:hypothetical protein
VSRAPSFWAGAVLGSLSAWLYSGWRDALVGTLFVGVLAIVSELRRA